MGWIGCVRCKKNLTRLCGTNFCTSSVRFAPSSVRQPNSSKCTQIVRNAPKHQFRVQWGGLGVFLAKNSDPTSWHELFALVRPVLHRVSSCNQTVPNIPKLYQTHQNISLGSNGVDRVRSLQKIPMGLHGTKFFTSLTRFAPSFVRQPNSPKMYPNSRKQTKT